MKWLLGIFFAILLVTLLRPAGSCGPGGCKMPQDRAMMKGLEMAIKGHTTEYPGLLPRTGLWKNERTPLLAEGEILKVLTGENDKFNPRKIAFWEPHVGIPRFKKGPGTVKLENGDLRLVDRAGNPIWILIDLDGDRSIPCPDPELDAPEGIPATVLLYTAGEDGNPATWRDNLKSWE